VVAHWNCLAKAQRDEILKAANEKARVEWLASKPLDDDLEGLDKHKTHEPTKKTELGLLETTEFVCGSCTKGGICYCCKDIAVKENGVVPKHMSQPNSMSDNVGNDGDIEMVDAATKDDSRGEKGTVLDELLFRCSLCKRLAHYAHLPPPPEDPDGDYTAVELAEYYQYTTGWQCADCVSFVYSVETILAWRPYPEKVVESKSPYYKDPLPREYLVKWVDRSYKRVQWVPHMWLLATSPARLKNFLERGSPIALLPEPVAEANIGGEVDDPVSTFGVGAEEHLLDTISEDGESSGSPDAVPDAERRIQPAWKTVDRVLDVLLWRPEKRLKNRKRGKTQESAMTKDPEEEEAERERAAAYDFGEQPSADLLENVDAYTRRSKESLSVDDADRVAWAFFKWKDLGYDNGASCF
jgi:chromodomain-helicase-DNA-binding protein 4